MAQVIRMGIMGAGWPGLKHAEAFRDTSGFTVTAVADLISGRRKSIGAMFAKARLVAQAEDLIKDPQVDAVSICLPNDQHLPLALAALKAGKHVLCEIPPSTDASGAKKLSAAAAKAGKVLLFATQRRFGGAEQAVGQAVSKGYIGEPYHARASWMRTRGIPAGTGWYTDRAKSGGGAMIDLGFHMLDLAWTLLGQPQPVTAFAVMHDRFKSLAPAGAVHMVTTSVGGGVAKAGVDVYLTGTIQDLSQPGQPVETLPQKELLGGAIEGNMTWDSGPASGQYFLDLPEWTKMTGAHFNWNIGLEVTDRTYADVAATPEPGTLGVMVGAVGLLVRRRRR